MTLSIEEINKQLAESQNQNKNLEELNKILSEISESKLKNSVNDIINDYNNFNDFIDGKIEKYLSENKIIISFFNLSNKKLVPVYFSYKKNLDDDFILKKLRDKGYDFNKRKLMLVRRDPAKAGPLLDFYFLIISTLRPSCHH